MQSLDDYVKASWSITIHILKYIQDVLTGCFMTGIAHEELRRLLTTKCDAGDPFEKYAAEAMRISHTFSTTFDSNKLVNSRLLGRNVTTKKVLESKESTLVKELRAIVNILKAPVESSRKNNIPQIQEEYAVDDVMAVDNWRLRLCFPSVHHNGRDFSNCYNQLMPLRSYEHAQARREYAKFQSTRCIGRP
ncbi:hypothetical protein L873DRAFT_1788983 [Choiromyces venosus 120613-1]|uniref:Uncharacterized protein n=1 Tax=Choiromyces venosus 120613-1 TaxID=1336337 RepID=A0A3N4JTN3_9PEZI|nr:hypothetical protein L873DRAFT_1788983 [Choiromyces venosus 120613-1]